MESKELTKNSEEKKVHQYITILILLAIKITRRYLSLDSLLFLSDNKKPWDENSKCSFKQPLIVLH